MSAPVRRGPAAGEGPVTRAILIGIALLFLALVLIVPIAAIVIEALRDGLGAFVRAMLHPETLAALRLSLLAAGISVPLSTVFGVAAAYAIGRYEFPGKRALAAVIGLPLAVSPVVAGMIFVLLFGSRGLFGQWLIAHDIPVMFAAPGVIIVTTFVTSPFVARELIPIIEARGVDEEEAALTLGASGLATFWRVTLPSLKWGIAYGVILAATRALGEFGAVAVVSGHIRGKTATLPLHVEILYHQYRFSSAFAVASLLMLLSLLSIGVRRVVERGGRRDGAETAPERAR